ncbi:hypothetical protein GCM10009815_29790 [Nocardioides marmoribigeumensis]
MLAQSDDDLELPAWTSTLDRLGASYDVVHTRSQDLTASSLVRPDGTGRYNAVLLTDAMQAYVDDSGAFVSALSADEWNLLWAYERDFGVRQATLYASYGSWPEDYCLTPVSEGGTGSSTITAGLTGAGAPLMSFLKPTAQVPITESYVYRDAIADGCDAQPVLTADNGDVLGVRSVSTDGRDRMALTFTSNQYLLQARLLAFGLFRWASRGMYFGEQRHYLEVDVDDWFNSTDERYPDATINSDPGFSMSGHDAYNASQQQKALIASFPQLSGFQLNLAYNAGDADTSAGKTCWPNGGINRLTATSRCLKGEFQWLNHTFTHPKMNFTDYATSYSEITQNLTVGKDLGLNAPKAVLKTGEYSGLGVYNPDPDNDIDPPIDHGLMASNPDLLAAAKAAGVKYVHGNMSFASHRPACFNCGVVHPMEPSIMVVPDWPTNIAYFATTPDEETSFYNWFYGPGGKFPFFPADQTYQQAIDHESDQALLQLTEGSIYTHTMHIGNLRDYGSGSTLAFDWIRAVAAKYTALYSVPLLNPTWPELASYVADRNKHFDELQQGVGAVYDPVNNNITVLTPKAGKATVSGARAGGATTYGSDVSSALTLKRNTALVVPASPLP